MAPWDAGPDGGLEDGGLEDGGLDDAGLEDGGFPDGGFPDGGLDDAGVDAGPPCVDEVTSLVKTGVKAAHIDAWWARSGLGLAKAPLTLWGAGELLPGDRIRFVAASGDAIYRIFGNTVGRKACPADWKLFFHNADGAVLWQQAPDDVSAYSEPVEVPAAAVRATLGFRDGEPWNTRAGKNCTTGAACQKEDVYFDNEGNRSTNQQPNGGCRFEFERIRTVCPGAAE